MRLHYNLVLALQKLLFYPKCKGCGSTLHSLSIFCFTCKKSILKSRSSHAQDYLFRYEGKIPHLIAALRNDLSVQRVFLKYLSNHYVPYWKGQNYHSLILAPSSEPNGFHFFMYSMRDELAIPLLNGFKKSKLHFQHRNNAQKRMDIDLFIAFKKEPNDLKGKKIILFDDVTTTGTTLEQCEYLLREQGAEVHVFSLAKKIVHGFEGKSNDPH